MERCELAEKEMMMYFIEGLTPKIKVAVKRQKERYSQGNRFASLRRVAAEEVDLLMEETTPVETVATGQML